MADYVPKDWAYLELIEEHELDHIEQGITDSVQTNPSTAKNDIQVEADVEALILRAFAAGAADVFQAFNNAGAKVVSVNNIGQLFVERLQRIASFGQSTFSDQYIEVRPGGAGLRAGILAALNGGSGGFLFEGGSNKTFLFRVDAGGANPFGTGGINALGIETNGMVGAQLQSPRSGLHAGTSFGHKVVTKSSNYTLDVTETVCLVDSSAGPVTIKMPDASGAEDRLYRIKKTSTDANLVTIDGDSDLIDGQATIPLITPYSSLDLVSDGGAWYIL